MIGEAPAIAEHTDQKAISSGDLSIDEIIRRGELLFEAPFNTLDGAGRPETADVERRNNVSIGNPAPAARLPRQLQPHLRARRQHLPGVPHGATRRRRRGQRRQRLRARGPAALRHVRRRARRQQRDPRPHDHRQRAGLAGPVRVGLDRVAGAGDDRRAQGRRRGGDRGGAAHRQRRHRGLGDEGRQLRAHHGPPRRHPGLQRAGGRRQRPGDTALPAEGRRGLTPRVRGEGDELPLRDAGVGAVPRRRGLRPRRLRRRADARRHDGPRRLPGDPARARPGPPRRPGSQGGRREGT